MQDVVNPIERRTSTDEVFDQLYQEIASLQMLPGTKLSEAEVAKRFSVSRQPVRSTTLQLTLDEQHEVLKKGQPEKFHSLDNKFHQQICELSDCHSAAEVITDSRRKTDRLCALSLTHDKEATTLIEDHMKLADALKNKSIKDATTVARQHLGRLDSTIAEIHSTHSEYFE